MRIAVCVRPSQTGEIGPFDAAAYESALRIPGAEVILLSMAPESGKAVLENLTRLGAKEAYLLCDRAFAGSDTLATTYVLSLALARLHPDLVFCGRQTMEGDTAQVGPGLATRMGYALMTQVMEISDVGSSSLRCVNRSGEKRELPFPALITLERVCSLRFPGIFSKVGTVAVLDAAALGADIARCGLKGSPTQVRGSTHSEMEKRHCAFIGVQDFDRILRECMTAERADVPRPIVGGKKLKNVWIVGERARSMAETVSDDIRSVPLDKPEIIAECIKRDSPAAILWESTPKGKEVAAAVAVLLGLGLCADCTALETDGEELLMYRPAFAGNVIAAIASHTRPAMATVRTGEVGGERLLFSLGLGAKGLEDDFKRLADTYHAGLAASRGMVDAGCLPYGAQIGLTGRTVSPQVYVAFGISGAIHHIVGMRNSCRVIAVNRDKNAPIFDYADFGIVCSLEDFLKALTEHNSF